MEQRAEEMGIFSVAADGRHVEIRKILLMLGVSIGLTINDVPKKNKKGKRVA